MRTVRRIKDVKIRKNTVVFLVVAMTIASVGWLIFLVFFGRIDPIVKSTTSKDVHLYNYGLITLPFWIYTFGAPIIYPFIVAYICNGNWILGIIAQIAGIAMGMILGAVLNISSSLYHVVRNIDKNTVTLNICIAGMVAILVSMINLIVLMISMPIFNRLLVTNTIHVMRKHEVKPLRKRHHPQQQQQHSFDEFSDEEDFLQELQQEQGHNYFDIPQNELQTNSGSFQNLQSPYPSNPSMGYSRKMPPPRPPPPTRPYNPYDPAC